MKLVIADTGPINYLIEIEAIGLLPILFERVAIPEEVWEELLHPRSPAGVVKWVMNAPVWLEIHSTSGLPKIEGLDPGETAAIALAKYLSADLVLIDEREGFRAAVADGLNVTGTLGFLDLAAEQGLIDFAIAIKRLEPTTFRRPETLITELLRKHSPGRGR